MQTIMILIKNILFKKYFFSLLVFCILILESCNIWWENKQESIAVVYKVERRASEIMATVVYYRYIVEGEEYKGSRDFVNRLVDIPIGSMYIVYYNPKNPKKNSLSYWNPIFTDDDKTDTTTAMVTRATFDEKMSTLYVNYTYETKGLKFNEVNFVGELSNNFKLGDSIAKIIKNSCYRVVYDQDIPRRSIINLDDEIECNYKDFH